MKPLNAVNKMNVIIMGPAGKMGQAMASSVCDHPELELYGAVGPKGRNYIGRDLGVVCGLPETTGVLVCDDLEAIIPGCDLVLDCTCPAAAMHALELCIKHKKAFVSGTTGFTREQKERFDTAGRDIPVILAYNTSRMMNVLFNAVRQVAARIGARADIDLIDTHDNKKPDAPSGTAKEIADIISEELEHQNREFTYGNKGMEPRKENTIAFHSIRSGGYPGAVKVIFGFEDEHMELSGMTYNMNTYAQGMIDAGVFLKDKPPGTYSLKQVFNI